MTGSSSTSETFEGLASRLRACRLCREAPISGPPLPHEPRPILQGSPAARLCIASQAPGARAHGSGRPFQDPSGVRLRAWLGLDEPTFYDPALVAIVPMGHCFPGHDAAGGDLPPRRECAPAWRASVLAGLPRLDLILAVGLHAQRWHLAGQARAGLTATVRRWPEIAGLPGPVRIVPLPHPSWRNTGWMRRQPWFEAELLPWLRGEIAGLVARARAQQEA